MTTGRISGVRFFGEAGDPANHYPVQPQNLCNTNVVNCNTNVVNCNTIVRTIFSFVCSSTSIHIRIRFISAFYLLDRDLHPSMRIHVYQEVYIICMVHIRNIVFLNFLHRDKRKLLESFNFNHISNFQVISVKILKIQTMGGAAKDNIAIEIINGRPMKSCECELFWIDGQ